MERKSTFLHRAIFLLAALILIPACRRSEPQNVVVLYCSVDQTAAEPVIAEFEKVSGVKVLVRFDSEATKTVGLAQKIRAEASKPLADVFWSNEIFNTILLKNEGLLEPYKGGQA